MEMVIPMRIGIVCVGACYEDVAKIVDGWADTCEY
jgi:hypothetical protein